MTKDRRAVVVVADMETVQQLNLTADTLAAEIVTALNRVPSDTHVYDVMVIEVRELSDLSRDLIRSIAGSVTDAIMQQPIKSSYSATVPAMEVPVERYNRLFDNDLYTSATEHMIDPTVLQEVALLLCGANPRSKPQAVEFLLQPLTPIQRHFLRTFLRKDGA